MIRGVLFDLYETLVTECDPRWASRPRPADRLGLDRAAFARAWRAWQPRRHLGLAGTYRDALRVICQELGHPADETILQRLTAERLRDKARPFATPDPDVLAVVDSLHVRGIRLAVVSNCDVEEVHAWPACGLTPHFEACVFSCAVALAKPDAAIYHLACSRLGLRPEECLFVGDGASDELAGAARAGLRPCWATWYLRRFEWWPEVERRRPGASRYPALRAPGDVLAAVEATETGARR